VKVKFTIQENEKQPFEKRRRSMTKSGSVDDHNNVEAKETTPLVGKSENKDDVINRKESPTWWSQLLTSLVDGPEKNTNDADAIHAASQWSQLVFGWMGPVLETGNQQKRLDPQDLDVIPLPADCSTKVVVGNFDKCWDQEEKWVAEHDASSDHHQRRSHSLLQAPSLFRSLYCAFGGDFARAGLLKLVHDLCIFVGPQVLNHLIQFLRDAEAPLSRGLLLTLAVTLSQLTMSFCLRHYFFKCYLTGLRVRTAVVVAVYRKALRLSSGERQSRSLGELTNLMSIDAQRMQGMLVVYPCLCPLAAPYHLTPRRTAADLTTYLHAIWYSFIQIGLALFFLWGQLGPSCLGGVVVMCVMVPVARAVAQWMGNMQKKLMKAKDVRVNVNSEVLGSMKVIKLQAWEESFQKSILELRDFELSQLLRYVVGNSISIMLWGVTPLAVALATFATYVLSGNQLDVASALTALALFDILRFPLFMLPQGMMYSVTMKRCIACSVSSVHVCTSQ